MVVAPTCGTGLSLAFRLAAITFGGQGRPLLFEADGYFEPKVDGIDFLFDMDKDGKAELVYMNFDGDYWITNINARQRYGVGCTPCPLDNPSGIYQVH